MTITENDFRQIRIAFITLAFTSPFCEKATADEEDASLDVSYLWKSFTPIDANEVTGIVPGGNGRFLVFGNTYSPTEGEGHWWGELSVEGKKVRQIKNWDPRGFRNSRVVSIHQTVDQSIWIVGGRTISKFSRESEYLFSRNVLEESAENPYTLEVTAAVPAEGEGLILLGQIAKTKGNADAWAMRVDASGRRVWEKQFDFGQDELIVSGTPDGQRNYLLVAISGKHDKFGAGFTGVRVFRLSGEGELGQQFSTQGVVFPASGPVVSRHNENIFFVCSRTQFPWRDAWLIHLKAQLESVEEKQIAPRDVTAFTPLVYSSPNGTVTVTWNAARDFRIWRFSSGGKQVPQRTFSNARGFFLPDEAGGGRVFVQKMNIP